MIVALTRGIFLLFGEAEDLTLITIIKGKDHASHLSLASESRPSLRFHRFMGESDSIDRCGFIPPGGYATRRIDAPASLYILKCLKRVFESIVLCLNDRK